jgi:hypothetical protein
MRHFPGSRAGLFHVTFTDADRAIVSFHKRHRLGLLEHLAATCLASLAVALGIGSCAQLGITEVQVVEEPGAVAHAWMREQGGITACSVGVDIDYYFPPTLAAADKVPSVDRWLNADTKTVFVGDFRRARFEPVGATIAWSPSEAWVMKKGTDGRTISRFLPLTTPQGRTVWVETSTEGSGSDGPCEESARVTFTDAD